MDKLIISWINTRGRGSTLFRTPASDNNVAASATILRDNMSLTASLIKPKQRTSYVLLSSYFSPKPVSGGRRLEGGGGVWTQAQKKTNKQSNERTNERRGYLSLLLSLFFFFAFTGTPCFVSQRATRFPFRSASKCLSSLLYSLSTWHSLIKVWNSICTFIHHTSNVKMGHVFHVHKFLEKEKASSQTWTFIISLLTNK